MKMEVLQGLIVGIQWIAFGYLAISVTYIFILSIAGNFRYRPKFVHSDSKTKFAVLIPGYKEDEVIIEVAKDSLSQNYAKENYNVFVIADSFKQSTLEGLREIPVGVIEVSFENSTKAKSINKALQQLEGKGYEMVVILDADNLMEKDFLSKLNIAFKNGCQVIQGHRTAKNKNTPFAILDAANEEINNHFFRKAHRVLGMSSGLVGSAMAFEVNYFKKIMSDIKDVAGEDKEIELKILKDGVKIEYLQDAYVFDEKVQNAQVFSKQRTRWIASQVYYFKNYMLLGIKYLLTKGNIDFFDKAFQTFIPPRILMLGALFIISGISFFVPTTPSFMIWTSLLGANVMALLLAVPKSFYNRDLFLALLNIPKAFFYMIKALLNIKGADKKFIHTPHTSSNNLKSS